MHVHAVSEADRAFRRDFEACRVTPDEFTHEAHVRLAYVYLAEHDVDGAVDRVRDALVRFIAHSGVPASKYHETLTRAWVLAVRHFMNRSSHASAAEFIAANSELLDAKIMLTHYTAGVLFSAGARAAWIEPDLEPIPQR